MRFFAAVLSPVLFFAREEVLAVVFFAVADFEEAAYAWAEGEAARRRRQEADDALAHQITVLHVASQHTYGAPRIHAELVRLGHQVNRKRVERIMRERGITGVTRRRRRSLTRPAKRAVPAPDLIGRDFTAAAPGLRLVGDITFIPTGQGWLYLATWMDLATRKILDWKTPAEAFEEQLRSLQQPGVATTG
ncbi:IS3 family transposase [Streptomyces microflavus]|uniref:IS3 family transposase n=1 Tax=Streptomyces microflavus TaxID=1919 RepID=UPI002E347DF6|nr:IS3 family transposase [Streptomyces microflavus]WTF67174.1 IS3 family transposase [Streptomyces microflavus]